jgi:PRA1 family protein
MSAGLSDSAQRLFSRENLRSPASMLGSGEGRAFSCTVSPTALVERIRYNCGFFYLNYMLLTALIFVVNVFFSPSSWMGVLFLTLLWAGMINTVTDERILKVGSK